MANARDPNLRSLPIAANASLSEAIDVTGLVCLTLEMPAAWTAAAITFAGSLDGENFFPVYDTNGDEVSITVAASRVIPLDLTRFHGLRQLKVRSGTAGVPVNQAADRVIKIRVG
jgi:hypothetical protein